VLRVQPGSYRVPFVIAAFLALRMRRARGGLAPAAEPA